MTFRRMLWNFMDDHPEELPVEVDIVIRREIRDEEGVQDH